MFKKILIANRGEIACRVITHRAQDGHQDRRRLFRGRRATRCMCEMADEAVLHRPGALAAELPGHRQDHRRLQADRRRGGASGLRLPVRERRVRRARWRRRASSSSARKHTPSPPWATRSRPRSWPRQPGSAPSPATSTPSRTPSEAVEIATGIGYPVMIKAAAGGGGKGMRVACNDAEAREGFARLPQRGANPASATTASSSRSTSRSRATSRSRCWATRTATCVYLCERECSIQRRHQKVIEEAPQPLPRRQDPRAPWASRPWRWPRRCSYQLGRHGRVRRRARTEFLFPRDEHAAAGRAPGHRDGHRPRPGRADDPGRRRREAALRPGGHQAQGLGHRGAHLRRGPDPRFPASPAGWSSAMPRPRRGHPRRQRRL